MFVYLKINICKYTCIPVSAGSGNTVANGASSVPSNTSAVANVIDTPGISLADWIRMVTEIKGGELLWYTPWTLASRGGGIFFTNKCVKVS